MTFVAYFALAATVGLIVFLFTGTKNKEPKDFMIITGLLFANTFVSAVLALNYLEVI